MLNLEKVRFTLLIFLIAFFALFINLGSMEPDIMEARNFITVREILESSDWLHPTMNGKLRLEKPPLPTWITAIFATIFGLKNLFFLRLPAALMALWMIFSIQGIVKHFSKSRTLAFLTSASLATMLYVMLIGRRGTWDIYTHSFMLASILHFLKIFSSKYKTLHSILGGLLLGASILSKGPIAPYTIFIPFIISYFVYFREQKISQYIAPIIIFITIGIAISSTWYIFAYQQFGKEGIDVLNHEINNWRNYNIKPWFYYIKDYPVHSGIWTITLTIGLFSFYTLNKSKNKKLFRFFWLWTILSLVLLSIVPEKKIRYLLPTFIPASFIVGSYLYYLVNRLNIEGRKIDKIIFSIHWWIFLITSMALPIVIYILFVNKQLISFSLFTIICIACIICITFFIIAHRRKAYSWFIVGVLSIMAIVNTFIIPYTQRVANPKFKNISAIQNIPAILDLDCYTLEETRIDLVWHIGKKIKEVKTLENLSPPYLLLTDKSPENYLPQNSYYQTLGFFDNNSKPLGHRHHRESLSKYVSIVIR